jgi:toxin CcdB
MARHDVFARIGGDGYLLDVQADLLDILATRIVVPLLPIAIAPKQARRLNPVFRVGGIEVVMATQFLSAVPVSVLGEKQANLSTEHDRIVAALDMAFQGF